MELESHEEAAKTPAELFLASFAGDYEDEAAWNAVHELRILNNDEVFRLALEYCRSEIPKHRARGLDVLAQLGAGKPLAERPHFDECVSVALAHLNDPDPLVLHSAAWALSHLKNNQTVAALIEMKTCPDPDVRRAVACGMDSRPEAIRTLIELMDDPNDEVRNWATFGLGIAFDENDESAELGTLDSNEIRDALRKRLSDSFDEVRDEALWGLALRKDRAGLQLLLQRLDSEHWIAGDEEAARDVLGLNREASIDELCGGLRNLLDARNAPA